MKNIAPTQNTSKLYIYIQEIVLEYHIQQRNRAGVLGAASKGGTCLTSTVHTQIFCRIKAIYLKISTFQVTAQISLLVKSFQLRAQTALLFFMLPLHNLHDL